MYISLALRGKNQIWRYIVSLVLFAAAALVIGPIPFSLAVVSRTSQENINEFVHNLDFELIGMNPLTGLILVVLPFMLLFFTIILSVVTVHERPFLTLLTARKKFDWSKTFFAIGVMFLLLVVTEIVFYLLHPENYEYNAGIHKVIPLAIVALFFLPFQTSAEEMLMRGYLMQGTGLLFRYRWLALITTSAIFGLLHFKNPEVGEFGFTLSMVYYIGFGLFMGILVLMDEGLELVLGVHFVVNFYSVVFMTYPDSALVTPALFRMNRLDPVEMIVSFTVTSLLFLVIIAYRYKWTNWKKLLKSYTSEVS